MDAFFQILKPLSKTGFFQTGDHLFFLISHRGRNILSQRKGKELKILKHYRENGLVFLIIILFNVDTI